MPILFLVQGSRGAKEIIIAIVGLFRLVIIQTAAMTANIHSNPSSFEPEDRCVYKHLSFYKLESGALTNSATMAL
jgi:hypothetical protein